jgi:hypothetical protein
MGASLSAQSTGLDHLGETIGENMHNVWSPFQVLPAPHLAGCDKGRRKPRQGTPSAVIGPAGPLRREGTLLGLPEGRVHLSMRLLAGFFLILGPPGGGADTPGTPPWGPKMVQMAGAAGKFLDVLINY